MNRNVTVTLAYNHPEFVEKALLRAPKDFERYVVGRDYPLAENYRARMQEIAEKHGCTYLHHAGGSVAQAFNWAVDTIGLGEGDIMIGLDPDSRPVRDDWAHAMVDVLRADPTVAVVALAGRDMNGHEHTRIPHRIEIIGGRACRLYIQIMGWPLAAFDCGWIKSVGGLGEYAKVYGFLEVWVDHHLDDRRWVMLDEYEDHAEPPPDRVYQDWKNANAVKQFDDSFEAYLSLPVKPPPKEHKHMPPPKPAPSLQELLGRE